jgi:hypothetical protein
MTITNIGCFKHIGKAYAHILSSNKNAALLEIFYQIQTEAELTQVTYASNITLFSLMKEHRSISKAP